MVWDPSKFFGGEAAASRKYERFNPGRYRGAPEPVGVDRARGDGDLAERKKLHSESERRALYTEKARPRVEREPTARD